jgi:hypothetical protein
MPRESTAKQPTLDSVKHDNTFLMANASLTTISKAVE